MAHVVYSLYNVFAVPQTCSRGWLEKPNLELGVLLQSPLKKSRRV